MASYEVGFYCVPVQVPMLMCIIALQFGEVDVFHVVLSYEFIDNLLLKVLSLQSPYFHVLITIHMHYNLVVAVVTVEAVAIISDNEIFSDDCVTWSPLNDVFEDMMGKLGLNDKKPIPEAVGTFDDSDPLGVQSFAASLDNIDSGPSMSE